jgi:gliding motility-associated-like protein
MNVGNNSLLSKGSGDIFIAKQDSLGNYIWSLSAGGIQSDRGLSICYAASGHVYITGTFIGSISFNNVSLTSNLGSQDMFIVQLDLTGNVIWARSFGGPQIEIPYDITTDYSGNPIITGQFKDTVAFDTTVLKSTINPADTTLSYDIFILKLDTLGNTIWAKQGIAPNDDRGISIVCDEFDNIYTCGQFSDTLQFNNSYSNNGYNVGYLMKFSSNGDDLWFRMLYASQVLPYDLKYSDNSIYLTGDFQGTLSISNNSLQLNNSYQYKTFILKLDSAGYLLNSHADGSNNFVTSVAIATDKNGTVYTTGLFKCVMNSFGSSYGDGIFNSAGYRDVFIAQYDSTLNLISAKQFGGAKDDYCSSISVLQNGKPVIAGSFGNTFHVPDNQLFYPNSSIQNFSSYSAAQPPIYCNYANYNKYVGVIAIGNKDIFSASPFDSLRAPFDFFERSTGPCLRDTLMPSLMNGLDTIYACDSIRLFINKHTGLEGYMSPDYDYNWSNGAITPTTSISTTGWYYVDYNYKDDCRKFRDSIYVRIYYTPPVPIITSTKGTIVSAIPINTCEDKLILIYPDTTILSCINIPPGYNGYWITPSGILNSTTVAVSQSGTYSFVVEAPFVSSCSKSTCLEVFLYIVGSPGNGSCLPIGFKAEIHLVDSVFDITDTVKVCQGDYFSYELRDSASFANGLNPNLPTFVNWSFSGGFSYEYPISGPTTFKIHRQKVKANSSGMCTVTASVMNPTIGGVLTAATRSFYLLVWPLPIPNITFSGPNKYCEGDTALIVITNGRSNPLTGPGIISASLDWDSVYINKSGIYNLSYTIVDPITGCIKSGVETYNVNAIPAPQLTTIPTNGIVCPNDSVQLIAEPGTSYVWSGPFDNLPGNIPIVYANTPGTYHYTMTDINGCRLVSAFIELREYSTPSISANPGNVICEGGQVTIEVESSHGSTIQWLAPLSGNSYSQVVTTPGIYTCSVFSCGITTNVNIEVIASSLSANISPPGPLNICNGNLIVLQSNPGMVSYNWMPGSLSNSTYNVTTAGTYSVEITDIDGCTSIDSIVVDTLPSSSLPIPQNDVTICAGSSVTLNTSGSGVLTWYSSLGGNPISTGNTYSTSPISNTTTFYVTNNDSVCQSSYLPIHVYVNPTSLTPVIFGDAEVCRLESLNLSTSQIVGATYLWSGPGGLSSSSNTLTISSFDSVNVGYYTLQISDSQCVSPVDSFYVGLKYLPPVNLSINNYYCEGSNITIYSGLPQGSNTTYQWIGPNGFIYFQNPLQISIAQLNNNGTYILYVNENGCEHTATTFNINIRPKPAPPVATGNLDYCTGDNISLNAITQSGINYTWTGPLTTVFSPSLNISNATNINSGIYSLNATLNGCISSSDYNVTVKPRPTSRIYSNSPICEGDTLRFYTDAGGGFNWTGPNGFSSNSVSNTITNASTNNSGNYSLQVTQNGCTSATSISTLKVKEYPAFELPGDTLICLGSSFTVRVPAGFDYYNWNNSSYNNSFIVNDTGIVNLKVSNFPNCITEKSFNVQSFDCDLNIPNIFSPNNDGINDEFIVTFENSQELILEIFNRWGEIVFRRSGDPIKWDGKTQDGKDFVEGTYFYFLHTIDYLGKKKILKGYLELVR